MTEPNAHEQLPPEERCVDCGHAWLSHSPKGCIAWIPDPMNDEAVCPCTETFWSRYAGDVILDPPEATK